jgi:uncharacterized phage infection (PIP) family protein YhgE
MKFVKSAALMSYLIPLLIYAAPKPKLGDGIATLDASVQSLNTTTNTLNSTTATLNSSTLTLNQTMQLIGVNIQTLNGSVQSLNTTTNTLNATSTTLNSSTLSLNQTNGSLNTSVQSLDQKINSLQGSVDALKASIDSLAANASGSNEGGSSGGSSEGVLSAANLIYITNCSTSTPPFVPSGTSSNYRCSTDFKMHMNKNSNSSDIIFEVPTDKHFIMTDFTLMMRTSSGLSANLFLMEKDLNGITIRKKQLTSYYGAVQSVSDFSRSQGGMIFSPGSKVILSIVDTSQISTLPFEFEMTGYLAD